MEVMLLSIAGIFFWLFGNFQTILRKVLVDQFVYCIFLVGSVHRPLLWLEASRIYPWERSLLVIARLYSRGVGLPFGFDLGYMDSFGIDHLRHAQRFTDSIIQPDTLLFCARHKFS